MQTILMLAANPAETGPLRYNEEIARVRRNLSVLPYYDYSLLDESETSGTDLLVYLRDRHPDVVHFAGHATERGDLIVHGANGTAISITPELAGRVFAQLRGKLRLAVFNVCYSEQLAVAVAPHTGCAIGMSSKIEDEAAIQFAAKFYDSLAHSQTIRQSFEQAKLSVPLAGSSGEELPRLHEGRKGAADVTLFPQPRLRAEFVLEGKNPSRPKKDYYEIRLFVEYSPPDAYSVVYQWVDDDEDSIAEEEEFEEVARDAHGHFEITFIIAGDLEVRAMIWRTYAGVGLKRGLFEMLVETHGYPDAKKKTSLNKALEAIRDN